MLANYFENNSNIEAYQPRVNRKSVYYLCVQDHYEELEGAWEERYPQKFGYWRSFVKDVIYKYLECGDLHFGFARVKCSDCKHEYLLPFSCKCRHFCPSCHQRRVVEFGEWLYTEVLKQVPHRQWVFSIPKRLRIYFMYDRKLLSKLSKCAWMVLSMYLKQGSHFAEAQPGAVMAVQTFGNFLNFHPHLHIIAADGCFDGNGNFVTGLNPDPKELERAFRFEVLKMLKSEGKITDLVIDNMLSWYNSGFNVYCGSAISPFDHNGLERLGQYIIRAPISQERMTYVPSSEAADGVARVIYKAKDGRTTKTFLAMDWLAHLITHIPNKGEQMVRYYGYYSNKSRGMRNKAGIAEVVPALIDTDISKKDFRRNWSRLIQKIYNVDPLVCPKCTGKMRIISFIEDPSVIKEILLHLELWAVRNHDPPLGKIIKDYVPEDMVTPGTELSDEFQLFCNGDDCDRFYEDDYSQVIVYAE
jgi:hypothetical protein